LAHAPTGIGKTVSALLPALRYALREDATVFYLTAKTTQREHVSATFEDIARTAPDVSLSAVTLRRKEHMCPPGDLRCHPDACPLLARFDERCSDTVEALRAEGALSPERIYERGAAATLCPYELSLELAARADVVIGDFNHVFDSAIPDALADASRRRVVVIDEAHNLFDRARSYESPFVSARQLRVVEQSLGIEPLDAELGRAIARLRVAIDAALQASDPGARKAMDGCAPQALDVATLAPLADEFALLAMRWSQRRWQRQEVTPRDPVLELASALISLTDLARKNEVELVAYVADDDAPHGRGLGIVCVDPSRRLESIHRRAHGTIAMSATLSPLDYFCDVLGLSRLEPILTSAPSPFASEHREVMVVPSVSTTYRERERSAPEIARLIEQIVSAKAGRYIAYFSSYSFLGVVQSLLTLPKRSVLVQLPSSAPAARTLLLKQLTSSDEPRLLLAVMGGVYGEGIDLPGDALIGAIVVGPGLPPLSFERLAMRHHYDATREAGFAYAMVYPGLQRVIQAAGRVIRGDDDRGVIVLLGRRFAEPDYTACLPPDWYRYDPQELVADDPVARLERFWRDQGSGGDDVGNASLINVS
jgi:Rad3-related DNA helicase